MLPIAVANFVVFIFSSLLGLPLVGRLGTIIGLVTLVLLIPGFYVLMGYVAWVLAYFSVDIPEFIDNTSKHIPKVIGMMDKNEIPVTKTVTENSMWGLYSPFISLGFTYLSLVLVHLKMALFPPPPEKTKVT